jgi:hypothetical protein
VGGDRNADENSSRRLIVAEEPVALGPRKKPCGCRATKPGADDGNRTRVFSLGSPSETSRGVRTDLCKSLISIDVSAVVRHRPLEYAGVVTRA